MPSTDQIVRRKAHLAIGERFKGDDGELRFRVSISSEEPVPRDGLLEVLNHTPGAIDMGRAQAGLPLLWNHDSGAPIGIVEGLRLIGKRLEGTLRFGKSREAQERMADVLAGVLRNVSVGYAIHETKAEAGGVMRVTRWEPYEASLVSIPADPTVGVNRSFQEGRMPNDTTTTTTGAEAATAAERERAAEISASGRRFNMPDEAISSAISSGMSQAAFGKRVLAHIAAEDHVEWRSEGLRVGNFGAPAIVGSIGDARGARDFSIARVAAAQITGNWSQAGREREMSQEIARRAGRNPEGVFVPSHALAKRAVQTSALSPAVFGTDHRGDLFINSLKDEVAVLNLGATMLPGLSKDIAIPCMTAGSSAQWVGEGSEPAESAPAFDSVPLAFRQLSATVRFSRKMAIQADPSFEDLMRDDIRQEIAIGLDRAAIAGTGLGDQPTGILNTPGVGLVAMGANGGAISWSKVLEFTENVEFANAAVGNLAFLTNARVKSRMMQTERAVGTAKFILDDQGEPQVAGHKVGFTNIVPANGTKGTGADLSSMIFGNWRDLLIGEFGGMDLIVDHYTESARGNIRVSVHSYWDIAVRHAKSFAVARDIITA